MKCLALPLLLLTIAKAVTGQSLIQVNNYYGTPPAVTAPLPATGTPNRVVVDVADTAAVARFLAQATRRVTIDLGNPASVAQFMMATNPPAYTDHLEKIAASEVLLPQTAQAVAVDTTQNAAKPVTIPSEMDLYGSRK